MRKAQRNQLTSGRSPSWAPHAKDILARAEAMSPERFPLFFRSEIEELFGIERHAAQRLMNSWSAALLGGRLCLLRADLFKHLRAFLRGSRYDQERSRALRVSAQIRSLQEAHRARSVVLPVKRAELDFQTIAGLPEEIRLAPGELRVKFAGAEDLLAKLMLIAQAAMNDFDAMQAALR